MSDGEFKILLTLLNPFAPHITEELWTQCGYGKDITNASWPKYDESKLVQKTVEIAVQINSKIVAKADIDTSKSHGEILAEIKGNEKIKALLEGKTIVKEIYVPNRIVNIIVK